MAQGYVPIDCGLHDQLELHAVRRDLLDVEFVDPAGRAQRLDEVRLATWLSRDGAEIGVFVDGDGHETRIRLDRLRVITDRHRFHRLELPGGRAARPATRESAGAASRRSLEATP